MSKLLKLLGGLFGGLLLLTLLFPTLTYGLPMCECSDNSQCQEYEYCDDLTLCSHNHEKQFHGMCKSLPDMCNCPYSLWDYRYFTDGRCHYGTETCCRTSTGLRWLPFRLF